MDAQVVLNVERKLVQREHILLVARECEYALEVADCFREVGNVAVEATWRRNAAYWSNAAFAEARA